MATEGFDLNESSFNLTLVCPGMKTCTKCRAEKPLDEFCKKTRSTDGRQSWCRKCTRDLNRERARALRANPESNEALNRRNREWYARNPDAWRAGNLRRKYGITIDRYLEMLAEQGGVCAICHNKCTSGKYLAVDHDHRCCPGERSCGKCVRSLLCARCNPMIAYARDNAELLEAGAAYLRRWPAR